MKWTFVVSCNYEYLISLVSNFNTSKFYGTTAEFSVAYDENISKDLRESLSASFPFKISWYPIDELLKKVNVTAQIQPNKFWIATWILAAELVDDYDSIAVLQADECLLTNVDSLFYIAATTDAVIASEYTCSSREFEELPFGTVKSIHDRSEYALYDQLVFLNKKHKQILIDVYQAQCIDPWATEAQQPMCALNQACSTYLSRYKVLGLDSHVWCWDRGEWTYRLSWDGKKLYNDRSIRINGFHCRPWQQSIVQHGITKEREAGETNRIHYENGVHNFNLLRDIQLFFNSQTEVTDKLECYRGRYE